MTSLSADEDQEGCLGLPWSSARIKDSPVVVVVVDVKLKDVVSFQVAL